MKMETAAEWFETHMPTGKVKPVQKQAYLMALAALRPVSQEQVEQLWPGCDFCKKELNDYPLITAIGEYGDSINSYMPGYCPLCGRPLTPEAWEETRKRMDVLKCE